MAELEFILNSNDATYADIQKAVQLAEQSVCPVWQMIKNNVEVISESNVIAP
jgi:putative redox protein